MNKSAARLPEVDIARFIGICIVILQHSGMLHDGLLNFLTIFHMPLFFVLSGAFIKESTNIGKLARRLLLPYFLFYILYLPFTYIWSLLFGPPLQPAAVYSDIQHMLCFYGVSVSWFLPALFFSEATFIAYLRKIRGRAGKLLFFAILLLLLIPIRIYRLDVFNLWYGHLKAGMLGTSIKYSLSFNLLAGACRLPMCVLCIAAGYYTPSLVRLAATKLPGLTQLKGRLWFCLPASMLLYALCALFAIKNKGGNIALFEYGKSLPLYFIAVCCGVAATMLLSRALVLLPGKFFSAVQRIACFYGRNTLIILLSHLDFNLLYISVLLSGLIPFVRERGILRLPAILIILLVMEIPVIYLIKWIKALISHNRKPVN